MSSARQGRWAASSRRRLAPAIILAAVAAGGAWAAILCGAEDEEAAWRMRLEALARRCDEEGLAEQAAQTRRWFVARAPGRQYLFVPPAADPLAPRRDAPPAVQRWHSDLVALRRQRAQQLYVQARAHLDQGDATRAYQKLHEVLREDPDHAAARHILGYRRSSQGAWQPSEQESLTVSVARTDHPRLGWRAGQYFRVQTPHFTVICNHTRRVAQSAAQTLETLDLLWRQLFFSYWSTPEALAARWQGTGQPLAPPRPAMQVVLFRNRSEYAAQVANVHARAAATLGLYQDTLRTVYFFTGDAAVQGTWYHEAAHQLFQESVPDAVQPAGARANYWLLEGVAMYLESLAEHEGYWTVGGCEAPRLQIARYRTLAGDRGLPWPQLAALGREALQDHPHIARLYTQAAGLTHFLMDGQAGRFRPAVCRLLTQIYQGRDTPDALPNLTGQSWDELEEAYQRFLNVTDDDLAAIPSPQRVRELSLGHTSVTDRGMEHVARCTQLRWLDLSYTAVTDAGAAWLDRCTQLRQLFLEGAKLTAASLPTVARLAQLEELDLSRLPLTDDSLAPLARLKNLKVLHLSGCPITDEALAHLRGLKQLEQLDVSGTQVTPQGLAQLRRSLPRLRQAAP
jgi:tetratricopeptide (TPR) repeat protein